MNSYCIDFLNKILKKNLKENLFVQSVYETITPIKKIIDGSLIIKKHSILERLCEPERQVTFKVT
jgi:glutamate dehydrogenase (NADP+)